MPGDSPSSTLSSSSSVRTISDTVLPVLQTITSSIDNQKYFRVDILQKKSKIVEDGTLLLYCDYLSTIASCHSLSDTSFGFVIMVVVAPRLNLKTTLPSMISRAIKSLCKSNQNNKNNKEHRKITKSISRSHDVKLITYSLFSLGISIWPDVSQESISFCSLEEDGQLSVRTSLGNVLGISQLQCRVPHERNTNTDLKENDNYFQKAYPSFQKCSHYLQVQDF